MKILLFDSNSILNRAFYGIRLLSTKDGIYTNAVYGFFNIVLKLIEDSRPDLTAFAFDLRAPTFRHRLYDGYKAQRKGMPEELAQQLPLVKEAIGCLGYPILEMEGYEADDILGTVARLCEKEQYHCELVTGDRDALQLVSEYVTVILAQSRAGGAEYTRMTPQAVQEKYGIEPRQLIETKALMGDSSDNIPGVAGVGEKTAFSLIQRYGSVEKIYSSLDQIETTPSIRKKLEAGREMALLSRELGEICCTVPLVFPDALQPHEADRGALYRLFSRLELHTLLKRLELTPQDFATSTSAAQEPVPECRVVLLQEGERFPEFPAEKTIYLSALDGFDWMAVSDGEAVWLKSFPALEDRDAVYQSENEKCCDDSKLFVKDALSRGGTLENVRFDARLAGYLLSPNSSEYTVLRLAGEYGVELPKLSAESPDFPDAVPEAAVLPALVQVLREKIVAGGMQWLLYEVEIPLTEVLASMELDGFLIDLDGLRNFGNLMREKVKQLEEEVYRLAGHRFNLNSPKQLGMVLFEELNLPAKKKTKSGYSTNAEVLEELIPYHEIISKILEYRKYAKLLSTYVEGLQAAAGPDSRIRTSFNQTETRTGRISSLEPNLQNIPIRSEPGSHMREFFRAGEGNVLVDADYSQIELRVLAAMAEDKAMGDAFRSGEDIHRATASQVFDMPPIFVTPQMRSRAKAVNFGIVYGISAFSLSKDIGVSVKEADSYIKNYLKTYDGVRTYMERTVQEAKEKGYAQTLFGRRRYLPELSASDRNLRSFGERVARNMPIQGTAADIIKIAMVRVYRRLKEENLRARLILQVHDELIVECPEQEAQTVCRLVEEEMSRAAELSVPLEVEAKIGKNWGEAH